MTILVLTHERIIELSAHHQVTDKCFKKCITSPGSSMGSSDQKCVAMCMDRFALFCVHGFDNSYLCSIRYMDSFNLVSKAYTRRLQQEM